jgi:hypothetical protein
VPSSVRNNALASASSAHAAARSFNEMIFVLTGPHSAHAKL